MKAYSTHVCNTCGRSWDQLRPQVQGNPLSVFSLYLHSNRLLFWWTAPGQSAQSQIVEPSWLGLVYQGQQDTTDTGMGRILAQTRESSTHFTTRLCVGLSWFIGRPNMVFCNQLYIILAVFSRYCCKNYITLHTLPILVHVKPPLHCCSISGGLTQLNRLDSLWLVAQFA